MHRPRGGRQQSVAGPPLLGRGCGQSGWRPGLRMGVPVLCLTARCFTLWAPVFSSIRMEEMTLAWQGWEGQGDTPLAPLSQSLLSRSWPLSPWLVVMPLLHQATLGGRQAPGDLWDTPWLLLPLGAATTVRHNQWLCHSSACQIPARLSNQASGKTTAPHPPPL